MTEPEDTPPTLFTANTLAALSGRQVTDETAAIVHDWVVAVVSAEIGELPDPVPPGVQAVALEVGTAAVPAPGGASSTSIGPYSVSYDSSASGGETGPLAISREHRARLRRAVGRGGANFSVSTTAPKDTA